MIDAVIFRIPTENTDWDTDKPVAACTLVMVPIVDGVLAKVGTPFTVFPDDGYANFAWNEIVLAERTEEGSIDHAKIIVATQFVYSRNNLMDLLDEIIRENTASGEVH